MNSKEAKENISKSINLFDIISFKEEQASDVVAWFLNPREAHKLKNFPFNELIEAINPDELYINAYKSSNVCKVKKEKIKEAFNNGNIIKREFYIDKGKSKDKRVDILICIENDKDKSDKFLIIIENKYGSKEQKKQTRNYYNYFKRKEFSDYKCIYVFMDNKEDIEDFEEVSCNINKEKAKIWNYVNYEWLKNILNEQVNKPEEKLLKKFYNDILIELDGEYERDEFYDPFFGFYNENKTDLKTKIKSLKKYELNDDKISERQEAYNYSTYYDIINSYTFWDKFEDKLSKTHPEKYVFDRRKSYDYITTNTVAEEKYCINDKWPFNIEIHKKANNKFDLAIYLLNLSIGMKEFLNKRGFNGKINCNAKYLRIKPATNLNETDMLKKLEEDYLPFLDEMTAILKKQK